MEDRFASSFPLEKVEEISSTTLGEPEVASKSEHKVGIPLSILNLVKNIIGTSMLSMSFGVACSGVIPSVAICTIFAVLSGFTFALIGFLCAEAKQDSFKGICEKYIHPRAGLWVDILLAVYTLPACIAYAIFVCDCVHKMLDSLVPEAADSFWTSRAFIAIVLTVCILLPLCCITRLEKLTFTSVVGIAAIVYSYIFVAVDLAQNTDISFSLSSAMWWPPSGSILGLFPMANIYAACYIVQYNAPKFFHELKNPTRQRFLAVTFGTNTIVALVCGSFAILGFARFGLTVPDNLLVAYEKAYIVWTATCVSLITTYPFVFDAGRRSLISAVQNCMQVDAKKIFWLSTFSLIPLFSLIAVFVDSLGLVVGLNGGLCGMTVGFTLPGLLLVMRARAQAKRQQEIAGYGLMAFGVLMTGLGVTSIFLHLTPQDV